MASSGERARELHHKQGTAYAATFSPARHTVSWSLRPHHSDMNVKRKATLKSQDDENDKCLWRVRGEQPRACLRNRALCLQQDLIGLITAFLDQIDLVIAMRQQNAERHSRDGTTSRVSQRMDVAKDGGRETPRNFGEMRP